MVNMWERHTTMKFENYEDAKAVAQAIEKTLAKHRTWQWVPCVIPSADSPRCWLVVVEGCVRTNTFTVKVTVSPVKTNRRLEYKVSASIIWTDRSGSPEKVITAKTLLAAVGSAERWLKKEIRWRHQTAMHGDLIQLDAGGPVKHSIKENAVRSE